MRISLINLDRSVARLAAFHAVNGHLSDVRRVPGVDGSGISRETLIANQALDPALQTYTNGAIGCALSHLLLWGKAVEQNQCMTIAEDDAIFHHEFEALAGQVIASLPEGWEIIQWGWNFDSILSFELLPGVSKCVGVFDQEGLRANAAAYQRMALRPVGYRLERSLGTVCQTISPAGARRLIDHCLPLRPMQTFYPLLGRVLPNSGIDNMMNELYPQMQAYVCVPPLVVTRNEHQSSTVQASAGQQDAAKQAAAAKQTAA